MPSLIILDWSGQDSLGSKWPYEYFTLALNYSHAHWTAFHWRNISGTWMSIPRNSHFIRGMLTLIRTGILGGGFMCNCASRSGLQELCSQQRWEGIDEWLTFLLGHYLPLTALTWHQGWQSRAARWQAWRWWRGRSIWRSRPPSLLVVSNLLALSCKCPSAWCRTPSLTVKLFSERYCAVLTDDLAAVLV